MIRSLLFFALLAACAPDQDGDAKVEVFHLLIQY